MIYQLTYRSEAIADISMDHINAILKTARNFNSEQNITGCLVFSIGFFVQLLEGKKDTIKALYKSIERDNRHTFVRVLSEERAEKRVFKGWDMAFLKPSEEVTSFRTESIMKSLEELSVVGQEKPNFTSKVFWYNIENLLAEKGYYRSQN